MNDVMKGLRHGNVLGFCSRERNLGLKFGSPSDGESCIEDDPSTSRLGNTGVYWSKCLVPQPREVCITVAFKTLLGIKLEVNP
jgi:hypothetical protein